MLLTHTLRSVCISLSCKVLVRHFSRDRSGQKLARNPIPLTLFDTGIAGATRAASSLVMPMLRSALYAWNCFRVSGFRLADLYHFFVSSQPRSPSDNSAQRTESGPSVRRHSFTFSL